MSASRKNKVSFDETTLMVKQELASVTLKPEPTSSKDQSMQSLIDEKQKLAEMSPEKAKAIDRGNFHPCHHPNKQLRESYKGILESSGSLFGSPRTVFKDEGDEKRIDNNSIAFNKPN